MTSAVVLASPFLPDHVHAPLATALGRRGWGVVVSGCATPPSGPDEVLRAYADDVALARPDVVLAHSNAGRFAAAVAPVGAVVVYVDAALPPDTGEATLAPEALLEALGAMTGDDGVMPPWTRWWDEADIAPVVPDAAVLQRIREDEPRVPLSYVRSRLGAPSGWAGLPSAYLAFGGTYGEEVDRARAWGWPVEVVAGALHLHQLVDPEGVADTVVSLVARVRGQVGERGR